MIEAFCKWYLKRMMRIRDIKDFEMILRDDEVFYRWRDEANEEN